MPQAAYHPLRIPVLLSANGAELQLSVCQRIYRHRNEIGQLPKRYAGQLVYVRLLYRRYRNNLAQRKRSALQIPLCRRVPVFGIIRHVYVFRGTGRRIIRTDEISRHYPLHGYDAPILADTDFCHPAYALQVPVLVDLHDAYRTHGARSLHRNRLI